MFNFSTQLSCWSPKLVLIHNFLNIIAFSYSKHSNAKSLTSLFFCYFELLESSPLCYFKGYSLTYFTIFDKLRLFLKRTDFIGNMRIEQDWKIGMFNWFQLESNRYWALSCLENHSINWSFDSSFLHNHRLHYFLNHARFRWIDAIERKLSFIFRFYRWLLREKGCLCHRMDLLVLLDRTRDGWSNSNGAIRELLAAPYPSMAAGNHCFNLAIRLNLVAVGLLVNWNFGLLIKVVAIITDYRRCLYDLYWFKTSAGPVDIEIYGVTAASFQRCKRFILLSNGDLCFCGVELVGFDRWRNRWSQIGVAKAINTIPLRIICSI